jgi:hypothetical protein
MRQKGSAKICKLGLHVVRDPETAWKPETRIQRLLLAAVGFGNLELMRCRTACFRLGEHRTVQFRSRILTLLILCAASGSFRFVYAQQPLEAETARLPFARSLEVQTTFEFQTSGDGTETAVPFAAEYGITDRLALMAEPVFYTSIRPEVGRPAKGVGDLEATLSYLALRERRRLPAFAIAGEVKIPTARNTLIGTRETDYTLYLIASKRFGKFDTHVNIGYTIIGKPVGSSLNNIVPFAIAEEYFVSKNWALLGEILANTASTTSGDANTLGNLSGVVPEAPAGELIGMLGFRRRIREHLFFTFGVNYDNNGAVLFRPGLTFDFNGSGRTPR